MKSKTYRLRVGWNWFFAILFPTFFILWELLPFIFPKIQIQEMGIGGHIIQAIVFVGFPLFLLIRKRSEVLLIDAEKIVYKTLLKKRIVYIKHIKKINFFYSNSNDNYATNSSGHFVFINKEHIIMLRMSTKIFRNLRERTEFLNIIYKYNRDIDFNEECLNILNHTDTNTNQYSEFQEAKEGLKKMLIEMGLSEKQANLIKNVQFFAGIGVALFVVLMIVFAIIVPMLSQL